jgi:predicted nucleic acid-binding protein
MKKHMSISSKYIFLDTNVWVQYLPMLKMDSILLKIEPFDLLTCSELFKEVEDVCLRPRIIPKISENTMSIYHNYLQKSLQRILASAALHIETPIVINEFLPQEDPKDWYIHNIGISYDVTIITGDKHLLNLQKQSYPIISSNEFLTSL